MNKEEYLRWEADARRALAGRYSDVEIEVILDWFRNIKGSDERELIGNEEVDAMLKFVCARERFDLYNSLMARLFVYAPLILEEAHTQGR